MMGSKKQIGDLDVYFASRLFRGRLDAIRSKTNDPSELKVMAFEITHRLGLKTDHATVLYNYLASGKYIKEFDSSILLINKSVARQDQVMDRLGVAIELNEDTTKSELLTFVEKNWPNIKDLLDDNYPGRKKRFEEIRRIDDYLTIADELNKMPQGTAKARKAEELMDRYRISTTGEIYDIALKYRSFLSE